MSAERAEAAPKFHARARALGLCAEIAPSGVQVCNRTLGHPIYHHWSSNGWDLCGCGHAVVEHTVGRGPCCFCECPEANDAGIAP